MHEYYRTTAAAAAIIMNAAAPIPEPSVVAAFAAAVAAGLTLLMGLMAAVDAAAPEADAPVPVALTKPLDAAYVPLEP